MPCHVATLQNWIYIPTCSVDGWALIGGWYHQCNTPDNNNEIYRAWRQICFCLVGNISIQHELNMPINKACLKTNVCKCELGRGTCWFTAPSGVQCHDWLLSLPQKQLDLKHLEKNPALFVGWKKSIVFNKNIQSTNMEGKGEFFNITCYRYVKKHQKVSTLVPSPTSPGASGLFLLPPGAVEVWPHTSLSFGTGKSCNVEILQMWRGDWKKQGFAKK